MSAINLLNKLANAHKQGKSSVILNLHVNNKNINHEKLAH